VGGRLFDDRLVYKMCRGIDEHPVTLADLSAAIHVWGLPVRSPAAEEWLGHGVLSAEEQEWASRLTVADRRLFITTRGVLRLLLGRYLERNPRHIGLRKDASGKPFLSFPADSGLQFSVSHSGDFGLLGFALNRRIGVDVERHLPDFPWSQVAQSWFAPEETALLSTAAPARRMALFYSIWTLKEAYAKALGQGLALPGQSFAVCPFGEGPRGLLACRSNESRGSEWIMQTPFCDRTGYSAAVAWEAGSIELTVRCFSLKPDGV